MLRTFYPSIKYRVGMVQSKEENISDLFVDVELKLDTIIRTFNDAGKTFESSEWAKEKKLTLRKFDVMVRLAEGDNEVAKNLLIKNLESCMTRLRLVLKLAGSGIFVLFGGPGNLFPIPGFLVHIFKGTPHAKH